MKDKIYYENLLFNQNITAKPNVAWAADITLLELGPEESKLHVFICIDIHTNAVIAYTTSKKVITSKQIIKYLTQVIDKRFAVKPKIKVIIHTDRGTQFSSKLYYEFTQHYQDFIMPSMSRPNTPTDNPVAERFMRTFKNHEIENKNIQETIFDILIDKPNHKSFRPVVKKYIDSLNRKPNSKSVLKSPERHDNESKTASLLMSEPRYRKGFSAYFGCDSRIPVINAYRMENSKVSTLLEEIAAKRAEIVDRTPFDTFDDNLILEVLDQRLSELYGLIERNPDITKQYVAEALEIGLESVEEKLDEVNSKIDMLLPNKKADRNVQPLRDPLNADLFPLFMCHAGHSFDYQQNLKRAQFRIAYTILYYVGLRINEIRQLKQIDIDNAISAGQFNLVHYKNKQAHIHVLSAKAVQDLKKLQLEFSTVFGQYKYNYLFGKEKPISKETLIRNINKDLKNTSEICHLPYNIKSHSFRVNFISNLLKITTLQNTADIIGHKDIKSTMSYKRYSLSKKEIEELLQKIQEGN